MTARRRDQRIARSRRSRNLAFAGIAVVTIAGSVVGGAAFRVNPTLGEDLCPTDQERVTGTILLLVDATDPWTELRQVAIAREVRSIADSIPRHARVLIYTVRAGSLVSTMTSADAAVCNPGTPDQVEADAADAGFSGFLSGLVSNPRRARIRYDTAFAQVINSLISEAGRSVPQAESPILETLRSSVVGNAAGPLNIIIISDLYQHSQLCSFYREPRCLGLGASLADPTAAGTHDLRGARVEIFLLSPAVGDLLPRNDLLQFWHTYFANQGAAITRVKRIEE